MAKRIVCSKCGHERKVHSRIGCLHNGQCPYGCTVKYMDRDKFVEVDE